VNQGKFKSNSKTFQFQKKETLMYGKLAMTCFKYQVYMYGSEAITYVNAILWVLTEPALWVIRLSQSPTTGSPPLSLYGSITITHLEENSTVV
jgi:hypothetical protein